MSFTQLFATLLRQLLRRLPTSPSSNANTVPQPRPMPNSAALPCAASRSPHGKLGKQLRTARDRPAQLSAQRQDLSKRVEVRDLSERAVVKLATERKHLTDIIKMVAYQAASDLLALLRPHYARADQERRTLRHEIFATAGDIRVGESKLHIILDQTATIVPGSRLRMRFARLADRAQHRRDPRAARNQTFLR
jgi:hypothetical protein